MIECVVINCMNGHMQLPIVSYTEEHLGILRTRFLTVAKPSYLIAANRESKPAQDLLQDLSVLTLENKLKTIALVAHDNHENETEHRQLALLNTAVQSLAMVFVLKE